MRATHKSSKTTRGWRRLAPKTKKERAALYARCGKAAFLDSKKLKFPIMPKTGSCAVDCEGLRAAYARAKQYRHRQAAAKAKRLGKRAACHWAP